MCDSTSSITLQFIFGIVLWILSFLGLGSIFGWTKKQSLIYCAAFFTFIVILNVAYYYYNPDVIMEY